MDAPKEVTLGGRNFQLQQIPGRKALQLWARLGATLMPGVSRLFDVLPKGKLSMATLVSGELRGDALSGAFTELFGRLTPAELQGLTDALLEGALVEVEGRGFVVLKNEFDSVFAGKAWHVFPLLWEALVLNYSDFGGAGGALGRLFSEALKKLEASDSQTSQPT